ncbi:zinc-binding dehydrogenase, partial [Brevibacterium yomogidense]|uniref:zinc-binding dehydrogenase n=1 Tax=Brevibacterium yomogidense TaxID=946573 RepID=UPI0018DF0817
GRGGAIDYGANVRKQLLELIAGIAAGWIHLEIERVYPFEHAAEALARVQTRHVRGKLVLSV